MPKSLKFDDTTYFEMRVEVNYSDLKDKISKTTKYQTKFDLYSRTKNVIWALSTTHVVF